MQHEIQYSIIEHLRAKINVPVVWMYDGVTLPTEDKKPYITVEQMSNTNSILSKQRESIATTMRFQIGLFAKTSTDRSRKQDAIKQTLMFDEIDLYDTTVSPPILAGSFYTKVTGETPIPADDIANKSQYHRVYFDVEVDTVSHRKK